MDPERYERIRDLFLAAEELPPGEQEAFLQRQTADDPSLYQEVLTLLVEHDPAAAQNEGENVQAIDIPSEASLQRLEREQAGGGQDSTRGDSVSDRSTSGSSSDSDVDPHTQGVWTPPDRSRPIGNKQAPAALPGESSAATGPKTAGAKTTGVDSTPVNRSGRGTSGRGTSGRGTAGNASKRGLITKNRAMRTHASPRYSDSSASSSASRKLPIWGARTRKERRRTSAWLWLAALLPTALIGWWTYQAVASAIRSSVQVNLIGAAQNVAFSINQFFDDQTHLVESWSRQPAIRKSIVDLAKLAASDPPLEQLRQSPEIDVIHSQLKQLSENEQVQFIVWNESLRVIASSLADHSDIGQKADPEIAGDLLRVTSGLSVLYGPKACDDDEHCFFESLRKPAATDGQVGADGQADPGAINTPQMAFIVPVENDDRTVAALMVMRDDTFTEFQDLFATFSRTSKLDAYVVNREGVMASTSLRAQLLASKGELDVAPDQIAGKLRVSDPGKVVSRQNRDSVRRQICPVTLSVAGIQSRAPGVLLDAYPNYVGEQVVGAWQWLGRWQLGAIVEEPKETAFAAARLVWFSFFLLGSVLFLTASLAASLLSRASAAEKAAVHPLSRYDVQGELGSGGMGMVYRARHRQLGREVALKVLRADRQSPDDRARFDREAKLAASLTNPHSVMIYDYGHSDQNEAFCVMQHLEGLTLQEVVSRSGHQPIGRVLAIIRQICDPLVEAHGLNLLHRDIKPQNIMLSLDNAVGDWAVLFDYGLAKPLEPDAGVYQTAEKLWAGTPMYMAPERFRDPSSMDPRSDIYSVGCIAYYLLAGRPPFIESDPESLFTLILGEQPLSLAIHRGEEVDQELSDIVFKCMAKQADDRFGSIAELGRAIDSLRVRYPWDVDSARVWWSHHGSD